MSRIVLALAGVVSAAALLVATAIVWLYLTQPAMVARAIGSGGAWSLIGAAAAAMVSAVGYVVQRL